MPVLDYPVRIESLAASERPTHWYEYTVRGRGPFPTDMLRFDRCWPADVGDSARITDHGLREVKINAFQEPRIGRWESFGWKVVWKD